MKAASVSGHWEALFKKALRLLDDLQDKSGTDPFWTFGGGTVLMLRYRHRMSKDVDIFVPDPQYLGYVNPRLSDLAESISPNYVEAAGYVKLVSRQSPERMNRHPLCQPRCQIQLAGRSPACRYRCCCLRSAPAAPTWPCPPWHRRSAPHFRRCSGSCSLISSSSPP